MTKKIESVDEWPNLEEACLRLYYYFLRGDDEWERACVGVFEALKQQCPDRVDEVADLIFRGGESGD